MSGAIREDDAKGEDNPQDDTYNPNLKRPLHHFYDPALDRPLTATGLSQLDADMHTAPAWALGTVNTDAFNTTLPAETNRRNHFTLQDAREAQWRALTGMNKAGSRAIAAGGTVPATAAEGEVMRKAYWATTFRALGDVLHLVEDMAQPQHTRNDAHADKFPQLLTGFGSVYEKYIEARATGAATFSIDGESITPARLTDDLARDYPTPTFNSISDYWSTREGVMSGKGLADYSNRGFFTVGTNLGDNGYTSPSNDANSYTAEAAGVVGYQDGQAVATNFLRGDVLDAGSGPTENARLTTESLFDAFGTQKVYSLNRFNYNDMARLLLPRAVAYSTGLIDYYFRGRLQISAPDAGVYAILDHSLPHSVSAGVPYASGGEVFGFNSLKLKLRNSTPRQVVGTAAYAQSMSGGTLVAVVKYHRNACYQPDLSGEFDESGTVWSGCSDARTTAEEIAVSAPLQNIQVSEVAGPVTFDFSADPIPVNATDVFLQVVYRGQLGTEADAVAVATRDISEPTYLSVLNATDYFLLNGVFYTPDTILNTPELFAQIDTDSDGRYNPQRDVDVDPLDLSYNLGFGGTDLVNVTLPPARYCRVAFLSEVAPLTLNQQKLSFGYSVSLGVNPKVFQLNTVTGITETSPVYRFRGYYRYINLPDWKFEGSTVNGDTSVMTDLPDVAPFPANINF